MKSDTYTVQQLFQDRRQYRVPFYQRPYVWSREDQWDSLWQDIVGKAERRLEEAEIDLPPHFLGAIVLEPQPRDGLKGVETLHVIDGQQRLTTLQYVLAALSIAIREHNASGLLTHIEGCVWNPNPDTMRQPEIEVFKLWPTFRDRSNYAEALQAQTRDDLKQRFPAHFTQSGTLKKIGIDHPPALEAIWYFREQIETWLGNKKDSAVKLERLAEAILRDLKFVSIALEAQDDAQVIFETLNGRGAELHATDLVRNFVFMRADREGIDAAALYDSLWSQFENGFWAEPQRRGRLNRPRVEWFMQSSLQAELADEIDVGKLYDAYRRFALKHAPIRSARQQLEVLSKHAENYRQFISGAGESPIAQFGRQIAAWDASPVHAVALAIAASPIPVDQQTPIFTDLYSYIVRRAICGLSTKSYNKVFLQFLKRIKDGGISPQAVRAALSSNTGDISRWPGDDEFLKSWLNLPSLPNNSPYCCARFVHGAY